MKIKATPEDIEQINLILEMLGEKALDAGEVLFLQAMSNCTTFTTPCDYYNYVAKLLLARASDGQCEQAPYVKLAELMECNGCPLPSTVIDVLMPLKCGSVRY